VRRVPMEGRHLHPRLHWTLVALSLLALPHTPSHTVTTLLSPSHCTTQLVPPWPPIPPVRYGKAERPQYPARATLASPLPARDGRTEGPR